MSKRDMTLLSLLQWTKRDEAPRGFGAESSNINVIPRDTELFLNQQSFMEVLQLTVAQFSLCRKRTGPPRITRPHHSSIGASYSCDRLMKREA